jgi:hypothetical protein
MDPNPEIYDMAENYQRGTIFCFIDSCNDLENLMLNSFRTV